MSTGSRMKLIVLAAVAAGGLLLGLLAAAQAGAVSGTLSVGSATIAPGATTTVTIHANVPDPGLGSWTFDVSVADPTHVSITNCASPESGVCNPNYPADRPTARFAGASASGLVGDNIIGSVTVRCTSAGTSALTVSIESLDDATVGEPQGISATIIQGTITCRTPNTATNTSTPVTPHVTTTAATATPTLPVRVIVKSGTGGPASGGSDRWLIAAFSAAGLMAAGSYALLRRRARG